MNIRFHTIRKIEGLLLVCAGLIHILFLMFFVDMSDTTTELFGGAMFFGIAYLVLGILILLKRSIIIPISLVINVIGLIGVIVNFEISPLRVVDPFLIVIDVISIPLLIYLTMNRKKYS